MVATNAGCYASKDPHGYLFRRPAVRSLNIISIAPSTFLVGCHFGGTISRDVGGGQDLQVMQNRLARFWLALHGLRLTSL